MPPPDAFPKRLTPAVAGTGSRSRRIIAGAVAAVLCLLLVMPASMWPAARRLSPLHGRVRVADRPVTFGTVTVVAADGTTLTTTIQPDGTYTLSHVPPGPVRIAVSSPDPRTVFQKAVSEPGAASKRKPNRTGPAASAGSDANAVEQSAAGSAIAMAMPLDKAPPSTTAAARPEHAGWFQIPGRYASPVQSGLRAIVEPHGSTMDLNLEATRPLDD